MTLPVSPRAAVPDPDAEGFRLLVQQLPEMISVYDADGRFAFASPAYARTLGFAPEDLIGRAPLDYVHPDDVERVAWEYRTQLSGRRPTAPVEFRLRDADGHYREVEAVAVDLSRHPGLRGVLVSCRDISDRRRAEMLVHEHATILEAIARATPLQGVLDDICRMVERRVPGGRAVVLVRRDDHLDVAAAPTTPPPLRSALAGIPTAGRAHIGDALLDGVVVVLGAAATDPDSPARDAAVAEGFDGWWGAPIRASDGRGLLGAVAVLVGGDRAPDRVEEGLLTSAGSLAAIAIERAEAQDRLAHQASHDALTGLPNRAQLVDRLRAVAAAPGDGHAAVYFLDLDRFKVFNDSVGHEIGDRILVDVGRRLRAALRPTDTVARFGGDEFVVMCAGLHDADEVLRVADRLLDVIEEPIVVDGMELVVSASVGVAMVDGRSPDDLLRDADTAMYHAKERGRARIEVYDEGLRAQVVERLQVERDLRRALDVGELTVHYQPVVALQTRRLVAFEALVRWEHPERGLLGPEQFLDVAEETGLIARIGAAARRAALGQWAEWRRTRPEWGDVVMAVNLAAAELRDAALPEQVQALIEETGVEPGLISLEATERVLASDTPAARSVLTRLRDLGVLLALDDFGTGSSPLLHLRQFPIHTVKLDGALVAGLGVNREDDVLVSSMIELCHRLGKFVVAEGVEQEGQARRLVAAGCLLAQGHLFAPALPAADAQRWADAFLPEALGEGLFAPGQAATGGRRSAHG